MQARIVRLALGLAGAAGLAASPALAAGSRPSLAEMSSGALAEAPAGYIEMCARDAALCGAVPGAAAPAAAPGDAAAAPALDARERWKRIRRINREVNDRVHGTADSGERWQRAIADGNGVGDCEDYAIEKRMRLIEAGIDPHDLFYAVAYIPRVGLHAVLVVRTEKGDMVLDSRNSWVRPWFKTGYVWLSRQSTENPLVWLQTDPLPNA